MLFKSTFLATATALCLSATATAQGASTNAPVVTDNDDVLYYAQLQPKDNTTVRGSVTIFPKPDNVGVLVSAQFWGIPDNDQQLGTPPFPPAHSISIPSYGLVFRVSQRIRTQTQTLS